VFAIQSNRSISSLWIYDCSLGDNGVMLVGKWIEVSKMICLQSVHVIFILLCLNIMICISVQTHKYIRKLYVQNDQFSAHALHEFLRCIKVRLVCVCVCVLLCGVCVFALFAKCCVC